MKIVIIGSSGHKNYVLDTLDGKTEIAAYAPGTAGEDMSFLRNNRALEKALFFEDWQTLIDEVKPDIVVNNTWYGLAAPVTLYSLKRGCHVFAEKPLSGTEEELAEIKALWEPSPGFTGSERSGFWR